MSTESLPLFLKTDELKTSEFVFEYLERLFDSRLETDSNAIKTHLQVFSDTVSNAFDEYECKISELEDEAQDSEELQSQVNHLEDRVQDLEDTIEALNDEIDELFTFIKSEVIIYL